MKKAIKVIAGAALALSLAVAPLAACTSQQGGSGSESSQAAVDVSKWNKVRDGYMLATEDPSFCYDEKSFVCVIPINGRYVRVVADIDDATKDKLSQLDFNDEDYDAKQTEALCGLTIKSAKDITDEKLSDADVLNLVGKTGQELIDDGFVFESYYMYGGDTTGANMAKGNFSYGLTFDVSISEDETEDEGAAIMDAKVTEAQFLGVSSACLDPSAAE